MLDFTSDQWVIVALIFVLGLLVGGFLFSGGGRKWKTRYNSEIERRRELERTHEVREKEWREQDSLRAAALKNRERDTVVDQRAVDQRTVEERVVEPRVVEPRVVDRDRVVDPRHGDKDHDGVPNSRDPVDDRKA